MKSLSLGIWNSKDFFYTGEETDINKIKDVELQLGYKLPESYVNLLLERNGWSLLKNYYLVPDFNYDYEYFEGIFGVDSTKEYSLCGKFGNEFWTEEWGYPKYGVYFGSHISYGHLMLLLDYRKCGPDGEPEVALVDQESDYRITFLAKNFEEFMRNLLKEDQLEEKIDSLIIESSENIEKNIDLLKNYEIRSGLRTKIGDYQGAEEDISKAIEINPENLNYYFRRMDLREEIGDIVGSLEDCKKQMESNSSDYLLRKKINYEMKLENFEEAIEDFTTLIEKNPEDSNSYMGRAICHMNLWQTPLSVNDYNEGIEKFHKDSDNRDGYFDYKGMFESDYKNIEEYDKKIELNPFDFISLYMRGNLKKDIYSNYEGAIEDYTRALYINPMFLYAYNKRGLCKVELGYYEEAIDDYAKATAINPNFTYAHYNKSIPKNNLGDYEGAIADCDVAIMLTPNFSRPYVNRGIAKSEIGDMEGAIKDYEAALNLNRSAEAYLNIGVLKNNMGDYQGAIKSYSDAIEYDSEFALAYYNRGNTKMELEDYEGAIEDYTRAINLNYRDTDSYYNRGNAKRKLKDLEGSEEDYQKTVEIDPGYARVYYNRGLVREELENFMGAIDDYTISIVFDCNTLNCYLRRAALLANFQKYSEAVEDYTKAIELNPEDEWVKEMVKKF